MTWGNARLGGAQSFNEEVLRRGGGFGHNGAVGWLCNEF